MDWGTRTPGRSFIRLAILSLSCLLIACGTAAPTPAPPTATPGAGTILATPIVTTSAVAATPATPAASRTTAPRTPGPFTLSPTPPDSCFAAGFVEPDPQTFVELTAPVREYLYYRKRAFIAGNVNELWARYPALQQGADPARGINDEARLVAIYAKTFTLIDGDIDFEHYERIKVRRSGDLAEVIVHMLEVYLRQDFSITGGQVKLKIALQRQDGAWTVVRTDDLIQAELGRERQCR